MTLNIINLNNNMMYNLKNEHLKNDHKNYMYIIKGYDVKRLSVLKHLKKGLIADRCPFWE